MKSTNKILLILGIVFLIIILAIFIPSILKDKKTLDTSKLEYNLINEGKYISDLETVQKFAEALHSNSIFDAKQYLSNNCEIYDTNNKKCTFEEHIANLSTTTYYKYEKRSNDLKNQETYRIYWNDGTEIQTIILQKVINEEKVYYEIVKCIIIINNIEG